MSFLGNETWWVLTVAGSVTLGCFVWTSQLRGRAATALAAIQTLFGAGTFVIVVALAFATGLFGAFFGLFALSIAGSMLYQLPRALISPR